MIPDGILPTENTSEEITRPGSGFLTGVKRDDHKVSLSKNPDTYVL